MSDTFRAVYAAMKNHTRPSVFLRVELRFDGEIWTAGYGDPEHLQGKGRTPDAAMRAFDNAYYGLKT